MKGDMDRNVQINCVLVVKQWKQHKCPTIELEYYTDVS